MANIVHDKDLHRIVATAIIRNKMGKYFIMKRPDDAKAFPGKWCVPGGGVELEDYTSTPKDTENHWQYVIEKTLKREVKEETNLEIDNIKYVRDIFFIRPDDIPVVVLSFYAVHVGGEVKLNIKEAVDHKWVSVDELPDCDLIEGIDDQIRQVDREINL